MIGLDPVDEIARAAFRALQARARADYGGNTQRLLVVYATESFLRRLAISVYADRMVLKGGMLMAASNIRQMTRDADLSTHGLNNDADDVRAVIAEICALNPVPHDGIVIDSQTITATVMREDDEYQGVRCKAEAGLGRARITLALDISFGDQGDSELIRLPSVIERPHVPVYAYPLTLNLAEKAVTAMQRRETSTRDRDFADLWAASRLHIIDAEHLRDHIGAVAGQRQQRVITMGEALAHMPDRQQPYTAMVERMAYLIPMPEHWTDLLSDVKAFLDPLIKDVSGRLTRWDASQTTWQ